MTSLEIVGTRQHLNTMGFKNKNSNKRERERARERERERERKDGGEGFISNFGANKHEFI